MTDDAVRLDERLPHHVPRDTRLGPPVPARLARFEGYAERLERGWRWTGRLTSEDVAALLAAAVRGQSHGLIGPTGAQVRVWLGDVWFDAESGRIRCELVGNAAAALIASHAAGASTGLEV